MNNTALDQGAIDAIIGGYLGAPFDVLGPHLIDGALAIRTFQPDAQAVDVVLSTGDRVGMNRVHEAGLFEAVTSRQIDPPSYQLDVT